MIEVTDEMVAEGATAWMEVGGGSLRDHLTAAYRAMRALEPKPVDRVERRPFRLHEEEEPVKGIPGRPYQWALSPEERLADANEEMTRRNSKPGGSGGAGGFGPGEYVVMPPLDRAEKRLSRRIDALTALVLELGRRSFGYPPGDATLQRLIAELEPTP